MKARILFIDAYDSFTNNIISILETKLDVEVTQVKIDSHISNLRSFLRPFSAVVAGPGPGNPGNDADIGLMKELWSLSDEDILPVLGICLGFQSLVLAHGGKVLPLNRPRHGVVTRISTNGEGIFQGVEEVQSVQYHSLHGTLGHEILEDSKWPGSSPHLWKPHESTPALIPLAWEIDQSLAYYEEIARPKNPRCILMAVKHVTKPFYGIQFHPESICSHSNAQEVIVNWWSLLEEYHKDHNSRYDAELDFDMRALRVARNKHVPSHLPLPSESGESFSSLSSSRASSPLSSISTPLPSSSCNSQLSASSSLSSLSSALISAEPTSSPLELGPYGPTLKEYSMDLGGLTVPEICRLVGLHDSEVIVLDSEMRQMSELGAYSIIGIVESDTVKLNYSVGDHHVRIQEGDQSFNDSLHGGTIFSYLKSFMDQHKPSDSCEQTHPFQGGLMGYITYEACLETIEIPTKSTGSSRPDICFAYIERSIVIDHMHKRVHVKSLKWDDGVWIGDTFRMLAASSQLRSTLVGDNHNPQMAAHAISIEEPSNDAYMAKIGKCQAHIRAGNSYELCLTNQTTIRKRPTPSRSSWPLYLRLRSLNPAPFSAYVRLGPLTLLSTSPERFMSWTRPAAKPDTNGILSSTCQFRPIKGTVKKHQLDAQGNARTVSFEEATRLLSTTKERAENLMIVDLIRHDLYGVVGSGNVNVKAVMVVEEYETVYQLVSVIEGTIATNGYWRSVVGNTLPSQLMHKAAGLSKEGIDVLAASLPPGSMTGAPKRRSCELLQEIEEHTPRSIYSGVLGYMSVSGGGDFSVVIRSAFKWDGDGEDEMDEWKIGAGGAVTELSTEEGEWEEMLTKMSSTMRLFKDSE
ncbi:para-aminobenzoate synthase, (PABA) [Trapelia coarctata]|nr:para-aminobenzoate synthase, (PABA) [Trapelia coarctata]